ncbi:ATP-binding protein [Deinococcus peraridilitoris]|uniref:histidine kinase n=1 Tax=Deinococcus peraridilitoris (strain DSM 19664 / LMG 22246 / CIP 109416 / KR-200) TaxID=937777 RepID=L0A8K7_DEIPD|nr:ATP-binding protein [Deinococcus peraridilitoris]AFZ69754.1 PAS domain S-box [Deinococcus peraridilitoris DSM 19664]
MNNSDLQGGTLPTSVPLDSASLLDAVPLLLWTVNSAGHITWGNAVFHNLMASSTTSWQTLVHPDDQPRVQHWLTGEPAALEVRILDAHDQPHWYRLHAQPLTSEQPDQPRWLLTGTPIHELKHAQHQQATLQHLVDVNADCIKILDLDARLLSMNEGGRAATEVDDFNACANLLWPSFWAEDTRPTVEAALNAARAGERVTFEAAAETFKGTLKWWTVTVSPLRDPDGHVTHLLAVSRDVSERHAAQVANDALRATLEERVRERTRQLDEERAALDAFVAFTEAVGSETDPLRLAAQAVRVVRANLTHLSVAYYEPEGELWQARVWSDDIIPEVVAEIRAGIPFSAPNFAQAVQSRGPLFVDGWNADANHVASTREYGAVALMPLLIDGIPRAMLAAGTQEARAWSEREKALLRAVCHGLHLAMERAAHAARLYEQNTQLASYVEQLESRTLALQAFETLTRELALEADPLALVKGAQDIVLSLLPDSVGAYHELDGDTWRLKVQSGDLRDEALARTLHAGLPYRTARNLRVPFETREAYYQDAYDPHTDQLPEAFRHIGTTATLPVLVDGKVRGVFAVGLFGPPRPWSPVARAVLATAVHSLGLALERAEGVARLSEERRKLGLANEELEAFTYSVSHDLRTPVRHIIGFNQLLRRSLSGQLDEKSTRYLTVVDQAAVRMNTLIDAMLGLSRLGQLPMQSSLVDLDAVVRSVQQELEPDVAGRDVRWDVARLPLVAGDAEMLRQVMMNLLSNALKYSRPREMAHIEVWSEERKREWVVFVKDNGVGFDPRYQDRLFGVFQRLHREDEFEGTGVGLANVRRIIGRHGGTVFAERPAEGGAVFGFSLPKQPGEAS